MLFGGICSLSFRSGRNLLYYILILNPNTDSTGRSALTNSLIPQPPILFSPKIYPPLYLTANSVIESSWPPAAVPIL